MQGAALADDLLNRVFDHGEGLEAEKVKFHQPGLLNPFHVELRRRHFRARVLIERHQIIQWPVRDHHTRSVGRGIPEQSLNLHAVFQQPVHHLFFAGRFAQALFLGQRFFDAQRFDPLQRNHLAQAVDLPIRHLQHPANIADGGLGEKCAKGDDLPHPVAAIFFLHVMDHLLAAIHAEINVEIGHADALGVQEPLEQQGIAQGVKVGDRQRIGHKAARARAPPRPHRNAAILGPFDEIGHDQEITGKAHALDYVQLELKPLFIVFDRGGMRDDLEPRGQSLARLTVQFFDLILGKFRQDRVAPIGPERAALCNFNRVFNGFRQVGKKCDHLIGGFEIMLRRQAAARGGLINIGALGHAEHRIMGFKHRGIGEIHVVCGHQWQIHGIGHFNQAPLCQPLGLGRAALIGVALQLDIKPVAKG